MKENGSRGFKLLSFWVVSDVKIFTGSYFVGSDIDVYVTIQTDGGGNYVSCADSFGPGIYYTLTGI